MRGRQSACSEELQAFLRRGARLAGPLMHVSGNSASFFQVWQSHTSVKICGGLGHSSSDALGIRRSGTAANTREQGQTPLCRAVPCHLEAARDFDTMSKCCPTVVCNSSVASIAASTVLPVIAHPSIQISFAWESDHPAHNRHPKLAESATCPIVLLQASEFNRPEQSFHCAFMSECCKCPACSVQSCHASHVGCCCNSNKRLLVVDIEGMPHLMLLVTLLLSRQDLVLGVLPSASLQRPPVCIRLLHHRNSFLHQAHGQRLRRCCSLCDCK